MNVRALTAFIDPGWPLVPERIGSIAECLKAVKTGLIETGYKVQTLRLATPPPSEMSRAVAPEERIDFARQLEAECFVHGIDYAALGPALPSELKGIEVIPEILGATGMIFSSAIFADPQSGLSLSAGRACAQTIDRISTISPDGFANLRFAALANVPSGSPFFPAAYGRGGTPMVAIATEAAELAVIALREGVSLPAVGRRLVEGIEGHAAVLTRIAQPIVAQRSIRFAGIDFSLAPFPEEARSLSVALETMGVPRVGLPGSIAAAAFIADCLDQAQFQRTGFCGLFFPVLEDSILARSAAEGVLSVADLLLYATICGTGLDTLPLPGDLGPEALYALLLDLGALALRHDKALTARLMPIPGKVAGDPIHFDFPYFADTKVMAFNAPALSGMLAGSGMIDISPHPITRHAA